MGKFNECSQKATPADNDTMMIYDAAAKANKLSPFSGIWNWIVEKLTNAVISNLQTSNKSVIGAINELNSKAVGVFKAVGFADKSTITIKTNSASYSYGTLIVAINQNGSNGLLNFNITPSINQTIGKVSVIAKDRTTFIVTFPNAYTHGVIIAGGSISKATFTVS